MRQGPAFRASRPLTTGCLAFVLAAFLVIDGLTATNISGRQRRKAVRRSSIIGGVRGDVPYASWREGPARYLLTWEEEQEFKGIASDHERARFVEMFWARRDPEPRTLINEYRMEFWKRVADSGRLFTGSSKPGWKTDQGRVYILLGPPDDRDTSREMSMGLGVNGVHGAVTWRYARSPAPHLPTGLTIVFTLDPSGEYRIETDPRVVHQIMQGPVLTGDSASTQFGMNAAEVSARLTEIGLLADLGRLEEVPDERQLISYIVSAEEFFGAIPFRNRYDFFAAPEGLTTVAITVSVHPDPLDPQRSASTPDYLVVGRIDTGHGSVREGDVQFIKESQFRPGAMNADPDFHGPFLYQAWTRLAPGGYRFSFAAFDRVAHALGSHTDSVQVPAFLPDQLSLSSLCLSDRIQPVAPDDKDEPYVIGNLKVTPRLIPNFHNGESFGVYYQIYSALDDPNTQSPNLNIDYQFHVAQPDGYLPIGRPIHFDSVGNSAQGWSFPLKSWPAADFRLRVTVTDTISGQAASREVDFSVQ